MAKLGRTPNEQVSDSEIYVPPPQKKIMFENKNLEITLSLTWKRELGTLARIKYIKIDFCKYFWKRIQECRFKVSS